MALAHFRMDEKTLDAMWTAIREALPELREYFKAKGRLLGHKNGLPFYDLFAPVGHASRTLHRRGGARAAARPVRPLLPGDGRHDARRV